MSLIFLQTPPLSLPTYDLALLRLQLSPRSARQKPLTRHRSIFHYFRRHNFNFNYNSEFSRRSWRSWLRGLTSNDMVLGLIIANVGIFLLWRIADEKFMMNNFTISLDNIKSGRLHTLITNAFSHVDTWHIVSNMVGLYFFGLNRAEELARYAAMMVPHQMNLKMGIVFNPEALELFVMKKVFIVYSWLKHHNIPKPKLIANDMARMLGFRIGDELYDFVDKHPLDLS